MGNTSLMCYGSVVSTTRGERGSGEPRRRVVCCKIGSSENSPAPKEKNGRERDRSRRASSSVIYKNGGSETSRVHGLIGKEFITSAVELLKGKSSSKGGGRGVGGG